MIATRLVPTAIFIGSAKTMVKSGTIMIPPPSPIIEPIKPAKIVTANSIAKSKVWPFCIDINGLWLNAAIGFWLLSGLSRFDFAYFNLPAVFAKKFWYDCVLLFDACQKRMAVGFHRWKDFPGFQDFRMMIDPDNAVAGFRSEFDRKYFFGENPLDRFVLFIQTCKL